MLKEFGGRITEKRLETYKKSPNWRNGKFQNLEKTAISFSLQRLPEFIYKQICEGKGRYPAKAITLSPFNKEKFLSPAPRAKFIWFGHSAVVIRTNQKTILIDPMLGPNAAPSAPIKIRRFSTDTLRITEDLPDIDLLLLTHDHYDHLDMASIRKLISKTKQYYVALGVGRHLESWGVNADCITEFDWWDQKAFENNITIHFTPSRHFSGRGLGDRFKSLWGGWVIHAAQENIYFSGDGGYGKHFAEVGNELGPFDFGFMECGQYNENWHQIHMYPEESVQAALDAKVNKAMPVHWGAFALAQHHWKDPVERFSQEALSKNLSYCAPFPGDLFTIETADPTGWWKLLE